MSHWSIEALQNTHIVYEDLPSFHLKKKKKKKKFLLC